ncbi:transcription termination factor Rho [Corynebacterium sp. HMSC29G08]|uniref:transcription termination factor Rho n=1 Tax=Corynebacterium sp. HMSC29G08 TaxID=1581069 RepID=UPI0008A42666|nr:transcription termination factor Rho [Corynebacterium sp. HMSC29G08]
MKLPELRKLAAERGLKGVSGLRKGDLIQAIATGKLPAKAAAQTNAASAAKGQASKADTPSDAGEADATRSDSGNNNGNKDGNKDHSDDEQQSRSAARRARRNRSRNQHEQGDQQGQQEHADSSNSHKGGGESEERSSRNDRDRDRDRDRENNRGERDNHREDGEGGGRRGRRGRRNRNRNNRDGRDGRDHGGNNRDNNQGDNQNLEPEELQEVAGIVDVVDNNTAFIRTTGYRQNNADVFVNNRLVRQNGLRSGDAVIGQVRANGQGHSHGNGRNRQRYNQLVRVDSVNGMTPEEARGRKEFHKLTPLYPNKRLRLETEPNILTTRVIDLVMPIGKGQRALIVSPPKAGKTTILQNIANAIATNNPECYLMVVLVDERPEEVTDMQRSVKGEVIASTFDRPPSEHTAVAELAIERAKRLVEMGQDVVVLLDSITRLGRAYNNSSPASGRILSGGVDSNALYPPKRFLGAARNIEEGGSLTIIATAMVETGSAGDTVIFEEFKGTGNAELKLDRKIAERRVFPAVDVNPSGTRKDELLMSPEEARVMHKLRRILSALDPQQSIDMLIKQLKKTKTNGEFLMGVAKSAPMAADQAEEDYV